MISTISFKLHDFICNNLNTLPQIGIFELQSISLANCVIEKLPSLFSEINFLSFSDANVSRIFPTPYLFNS